MDVLAGVSGGSGFSARIGWVGAGLMGLCGSGFSSCRRRADRANWRLWSPPILPINLPLTLRCIGLQSGQVHVSVALLSLPYLAIDEPLLVLHAPCTARNTKRAVGRLTGCISLKHIEHSLDGAVCGSQSAVARPVRSSSDVISRHSALSPLAAQ